MKELLLKPSHKKEVRHALMMGERTVLSLMYQYEVSRCAIMECLDGDPLPEPLLSFNREDEMLKPPTPWSQIVKKWNPNVKGDSSFRERFNRIPRDQIRTFKLLNAKHKTMY